MSRTYKDRPTWVKKFDPAIPSHVSHDHTKGECIEETFEIARKDAGHSYPQHYNHYSRCNKREKIVFTCTKASPARPRSRYTPRCWSLITSIELTRRFPYEKLPNGTVCITCGSKRPIDTGYGHRCFMFRLGCVGHHETIIHEDAPCSCDRWDETYPDITCFRTFSGSGREWYKHYSEGPTRDFVHADYHNPERRRARDTLRGITKEFNTFGDIDEITDDYYSRPPRSSAQWNWW